MLRAGFGGLIPVVKGSLIPSVIEFARAEGRERDVVVLGPQSKHVFNPLEHETRPAEAQHYSRSCPSPRGRARDGTNEAFWREQLAIILRHLFTLCQVTCGRLDLLVPPSFSTRAQHPGRGGRSRVANIERDGASEDKVIRQSARPEVLDAVSYFARSSRRTVTGCKEPGGDGSGVFDICAVAVAGDFTGRFHIQHGGSN